MGLHLNLARQETRRAAGVLRAVLQAHSSEAPDLGWFAATTDDDATAAAAHAEALANTPDTDEPFE